MKDVPQLVFQANWRKTSSKINFLDKKNYFTLKIVNKELIIMDYSFSLKA